MADSVSGEGEEQIRHWCELVSKNGIEQHSAEWLMTKRYTVGGSSIAIIAGIGAFKTLRDYISDKLGITHFKTNIMPQWGNLFEDVIKREIEYKYGCIVYGEDLYVPGDAVGTSYSPDGLGVVDGKIVLFEFKCPYSRIPGREPPKHYVPQVKMGLELIPIADHGLYAEGVYRRCTWDDLGPNAIFDNTLVDKPSKPMTPISYGFVGVYVDSAAIARIREKMQRDAFEWQRTSRAADSDVYDDSVAPEPLDPLGMPLFQDEYGDYESQDYDLSQANPDLFRNIMAAIDAGYLSVWHSTIIRERDPKAANSLINSELRRYHAETGAIAQPLRYGLISWKLLRLETHRIDREPGYLEPYLPKIKMIVDFVKGQWDSGASIPQKMAALDRFMNIYDGDDLYDA